MNACSCVGHRRESIRREAERIFLRQLERAYQHAKMLSERPRPDGFDYGRPVRGVGLEDEQ